MVMPFTLATLATLASPSVNVIASYVFAVCTYVGKTA